MTVAAMRLARVAVLAIPTLAAAQSASVPAAKSAAMFTQMKALAGDWETVQDGVRVKESYAVTANGSVLMATTVPGNESPMITMFSVDGDRLIATHYCSAGNQPQMVSGAPEDLHTGVTFKLARVTGLKTPDDWHNTGITITLDDADHMTQRWTYLYKGRAGTTVFHYTRTK